MIADCIVWWEKLCRGFFGLDIICVFRFVFEGYAFILQLVQSSAQCSTSVILNMGPRQAVIKEPISISVLHQGTVSDIVALFLS